MWTLSMYYILIYLYWMPFLFAIFSQSKSPSQLLCILFVFSRELSINLYGTWSENLLLSIIKIRLQFIWLNGFAFVAFICKSLENCCYLLFILPIIFYGFPFISSFLYSANSSLPPKNVWNSISCCGFNMKFKIACIGSINWLNFAACM